MRSAYRSEQGARFSRGGVQNSRGASASRRGNRGAVKRGITLYRVLYRGNEGQQRSPGESLPLVHTLHTGRAHSNNAAQRGRCRSVSQQRLTAYCRVTVVLFYCGASSLYRIRMLSSVFTYVHRAYISCKACIATLHTTLHKNSCTLHTATDYM